MEDLIKVKNNETDDVFWMVKGKPSRYIEGEEYIPIKKHPDSNDIFFLRRKSLVFHWK